MSAIGARTMSAIGARTMSLIGGGRGIASESEDEPLDMEAYASVLNMGFDDEDENDEGKPLKIRRRVQFCCVGAVFAIVACALFIPLHIIFPRIVKQHGIPKTSNGIMHAELKSTSLSANKDAQNFGEDVEQMFLMQLGGLANGLLNDSKETGSHNVSVDRAFLSNMHEAAVNLTSTMAKPIELATAMTSAKTLAYFPRIAYTGPRHDVAYCFCQIAGNCPVSQNTPCACRQSLGNPKACAGFALAEKVQTTTFANINKAKRCGHERDTALLTIPKSYVANIADMRKASLAAQQHLLEAMLVDGFSIYQEKIAVVHNERVNQCIHHPDIASVKWLHLHTFCSEGNVDGQPNDKYSYCFKMANLADAPSVAKAMLAASRESKPVIARRSIKREHDIQEWIGDNKEALDRPMA
jgi:hypothetical protein